MSNHNSSIPIIALSRTSEQSGDSLIIGVNTFVLFLDKAIGNYVKQLTGMPTYHPNSYEKINQCGINIILIGDKNQLEQLDSLEVLFAKDNNTVYRKFYNQLLGVNDSRGFMNWLEKLRSDQRVIELEKWLLLSSTERHDDNLKPKVSPSKKSKPVKPIESVSIPELAYVDDCANDYADDSTEGNANNKSTLQVKAVNCCLETLGDKIKYHDEQSCFRRFNGKFWSQLRPNAFKKMVLDVCENCDILYTDSLLNSAINVLKVKLHPLEWNTPDGLKYLNFQNGILDLTTGILKPHSKDFLFTDCLGLEYSVMNLEASMIETLAIKAPVFYQYLNHSFKGNLEQMLKLLACMNGIIKKRFYRLHKFLYIYGDSGTGKGVFLNVLEAMVGSSNCCECPINDLSQDYKIAELIDKTLITDSDTEPMITKSGVTGIKRLTGGNKVSYRSPYEKPGSALCTGTIIAVSNYSAFKGTIRGIDRRFCYLQFLNAVNEELRDEYLADKIISELPSIIPIILFMPDDEVRNRIKGIGEYQIAEYVTASWLHKTKSCSVANFLEQRIVWNNDNPTETIKVGDKNSSGETSTLYPNYLDLCERDGFKPVGKTEFIERLEDHIKYVEPPLVVAYRARTKYARNVFVGVRLRASVTDDKLPFISEWIEQKNEEKNSFKSLAQKSVTKALNFNEPLENMETVVVMRLSPHTLKLSPGDKNEDIGDTFRGAGDTFTDADDTKNINPDQVIPIDGKKLPSEPDSMTQFSEKVSPGDSFKMWGDSRMTPPFPYFADVLASGDRNEPFLGPKLSNHFDENIPDLAPGFKVKWQDRVLFIPFGKTTAIEGIITNVSNTNTVGITSKIGGKEFKYVNRRSIIAIIE